MKTTEFIDALERQNIIPADIIAKLRGKLKSTDKDITAKSVAKYLIDKGYLTKFQAKQVLTASSTPPKEELELNVPEDQVNDTNELLKDLNPAQKAAAPVADPDPSPAHDATRTFQEPDGTEVVPYEASVDVVDVQHEQTIQQGLGLDQGLPQQDYDPMNGGFESEEADLESELGPSDGFRGKKSKRNQWDSKWIFIGSTVLALLLIAAAVLGYTIFKTDSAKLWTEVNENFANQRYPQAIDGGLKFIDKFPSDPNVPNARRIIVNSELRLAYDSSRWDDALKRSQDKLPELWDTLEKNEETEAFADLRPELGVILPGTAVGFTDIGLEANDIETKRVQLAKTMESMELINNPTYMPTSIKNSPAVDGKLTELKEKIGLLSREIKREQDYAAAVQTMSKFTDDGETQKAFRTFEELIAEYPELKTREEIQQELKDISLRESDLVKTIEISLDTPPLPDTPIASSIILATKSGQSSILGIGNDMLVYLIEGALFGIRAADGHVVWRRFVGLETKIDPQWLGEPNRSDIVAVDERSNQLMRLTSLGQEVWRVAIEEPFAKPTITDDGFLLVTTISGLVMKLDAETGGGSLAAQLPKQATVPAVTIEGTPYIYQVGIDSNLYVISKDTMTCSEVYFLGHDSRTVSVPPFVISGHLVVPVNGSNFCNLHIIKPFENGLQLGLAQPTLRLVGQVNTDVLRLRRWGLVMSDGGDLRMMEINRTDEGAPLSFVARQKITNTDMSTSYMSAQPGYLWISGGAGIRLFRIRKQVSEFREEVVTNNLDRFVAPSSLIGETLYHVRRRDFSSLVSVTAVNSLTLKELWRTDFAAPLAGPPITMNGQTFAVSAQGDMFTIDNDAIEKGSSNRPYGRASNVVQTLVFDNVVDFNGKHVITGPLDRRNIVTIDPERDPVAKLVDLQPPGDKPSCRPIAFGDSLLVATTDRLVVRINPETGQSVGAPFQPPRTPNTTTLWREPAVNGNRFIIGDAQGFVYLVEAQGQTSLQDIDETQLAGDLTSPFINFDEVAYGVTRDDTGDRLVAINFASSLEETGDLELDGSVVQGPIRIADDRMIVVLDSGETACIGTDLELIWTSTVPLNGSEQMIGSPTVVSGQLMVAFSSGKIVSVDPNTGEIQGEVDLGQPISQPPIEVRGQMFVPGADGTLHRLDGLAW